MLPSTDGPSVISYAKSVLVGSCYLELRIDAFAGRQKLFQHLRDQVLRRPFKLKVSLMRYFPKLLEPFSSGSFQRQNLNEQIKHVGCLNQSRFKTGSVLVIFI